MMIESLLRRLIAHEAVPLADALEAQLELTLIRQQLEMANTERVPFELIMAEIYKAVEGLGGGLALLGAIGSYNDSLPDDEVLFLLTKYNDAAMRKETEV